MSDIMSVIKDEQLNFSMSRVLVAVWTVVIFILIFCQFEHLTQPVLTFLSSIYLFLCTWAAGPRIAQYLAPQLGALASAVGQANKPSLNSTDLKEAFDKQNNTAKTVG